MLYHCIFVLPEILRAPESVAVFPNQSAKFTCETRDGATLWRINGIQREILPLEIRNDLVVSKSFTAEGTTVENVTIRARVHYNGTTIQCLSVIIGVSTVESENATLTIQG